MGVGIDDGLGMEWGHSSGDDISVSSEELAKLGDPLGSVTLALFHRILLGKML